MSPASLRLHYSSSYPIEYTSLTATPFPWLEATYRYAEIKNRNMVLNNIMEIKPLKTKVLT